ncbi:MAG: hypothetical protein JSS27_20195 [Planctomycetes bacterium]|nr:hypothetical protein [Planctomycetota bacterium]
MCKGFAPIFPRLVDTAWSWFKWGLLLVVLGSLVVGPYCFQKLNEEVRRRVQFQIAQHYRDMSIRVRAARIIDGEGIEIRGLAIADPKLSGPPADLAYFDEMTLACSTNLADMARNQLQVRQITLRKLTLRGVRHADGTWTLGQLLPLPQLSDRPPPVVLEDATIELFDPHKTPSTVMRLRNVNLRLEPIDPATTQGQQRMALRGHLMTDQVRRIDVQGWIDCTGKAWRLAATIDGMELGPDLATAMPCPCPQQVLALQALRAQLNAHVVGDYDARRAQPLIYEARGQIQRGRWDDARLPHPITDLKIKFHCDDQGCRIEELAGRIGQAELTASGQRQGYLPDSPIRLHVAARRLVVESSWLRVLPERFQEEWRKYQPAGEIDLDGDLLFDGRTWQIDGECKLLNMSFCYFKFPYRLDNACGALRLKQHKLSVNLVAKADDAPVQIISEWAMNQTPLLGWAEIHAQQARFNDRLIEALPERTALVVRQLRAAGTCDAVIRFWRSTETGVPEEHKSMLLTLRDCSMRYDKFPYPVHNIVGQIEMFDNLWTFKRLAGKKGPGAITCDGTLVTSSAGGDLKLHITGQQVGLEDELRDALTPAARQLWLDLKPQGTVNVAADVRVLPGGQPVQLFIRAEPAADNVSIEPARFPYRMDNIHGVFTIADGRATIENLRAEHGRTRLNSQVECLFSPDGGWALRFNQMTVDRVQLDRPLMLALPERLRKALAELQFSGAFNMRGAFELASTGRPNEPTTSGWDMEFDLHQNAGKLGVPLDNLNGGVHLRGNFDGKQFQSQGTVHLDSATYRDLQLTDVSGPLWIDDTRLLVGVWADRLLKVAPERHLAAQLYSGTAMVDGWLLFGPQSPYEFQMALNKGSLARWNQEALGNRERLSGDIYAQLTLRGKGKSLHDLGGRGSIELKNANIYELPLMVSLLKVLNLRQPDLTAFTSSDINFRVEGEHLYLDRFDLTGDVVSLLGQGEVNLNRQIHLTFHTMVGANAGRQPMLRTVLGSASQQIMLIHAEGTLDQPQLRSEAFPGVNQALQQLQAELGAKNTEVK